MSHPTDERVLAFLDGDLAPGEADTTGSHIAGCQACRARADKLAAAGLVETQVGQAIRAGGEEESVPSYIQERIRAAAREAVTPERQAVRPEANRAPWYRRLFPVTATLAVAAAAAFLLIPRPASTPDAASSFLLAADKADWGVRGEVSVGGTPGLSLATLKDVQAAIVRGDLKLRQATAPGCTPPELHRAGAFDDKGRLRAYLRRDTTALEVHVFDDLGTRVGATRLLLPSGRVERVPPLRIDQAEDQLTHPACSQAQ